MNSVLEDLRQQYIAARTQSEMCSAELRDIELGVLRDFNAVDKNGNPAKSWFDVCGDKAVCDTFIENARRAEESGYSAALARAYREARRIEDKIWNMLLDEDLDIIDKFDFVPNARKQQYIEWKLGLEDYKWKSSLERDEAVGKFVV